MPYLVQLLLLTVALTLPTSVHPQSGTPREDDVRCLQGIKTSLSDPDGRLASWTFSNTSAGAICELSGVSCWSPDESRIIGLSLSGFGLTGAIPSELQFCSAITALDLSSNRLGGQIPPALCDWLPFVVNLDLSGNQLSGPIPAELANCKFINSLKLSANSHSGKIPASLVLLGHLKSLDLSNNNLDGAIPPQLAASFSADAFADNPDLVEPHSGFDLGVLFGRPEAAAAIAFVFGFVGTLFFGPSIIRRVAGRSC
uniref:Leucine-rich repeat-containing N-terminal plant-type domain-containing protein n=1 Tax=Oryza rufipogon TaxID=4529 RepID=A0A0E0PM74_ORYRU